MGNIFGEQFRRLREKAGVSRSELARRLGYRSTSYLYDIETGVFIPTDDHLRELAGALGVPLSRLRGLALEAKVQEIGIREPGFVSMLKDYPRLSRQDKQAIVDAYRRIRRERGWTE